MTQAINLANFSNNLDSSGGLNPNALNAPTPISKGGTGASTAAGAATNLGSAIFSQIVGSIYPVGSIYMNTASTNPATLFGFGTWTQLAPGRMLMGAGGSYGAGTTGGSADAIVVSHSHTATTTASQSAHSHTAYTGTGGPGSYGYAGNGVDTGWGTLSISSAQPSISASTSISSAGASGTNANLPPYLVVYMWQRTA